MADDPNYHVNGVPRAIRAKITQLINAAHDAAFVGSAHPEDRDDILGHQAICRMNLEATIVTHLKRLPNSETEAALRDSRSGKVKRVTSLDDA